MKEIIFNTKYNNKYLYLDGNIVFLHNNFFNSIDGSTDKLDNYYTRKFIFLKEKLSKESKNITYTTNITPQIIKENIANLKQLLIEVTDGCNLACEYCGYGKLYGNYDKRNGKMQSFQQVRILLDFLINEWNSQYNNSYKNNIYIGFYGGEPLLNFKLIHEVIEYLDSKCMNNIIFQYNMTTNAMLLDRYMDYLKEKQVHLLISIDGNKENHSYRITKTGKNSFDTVYSNILKLKNKLELSVINLNEFHAVNENILSKYEIHTDNVCTMMKKIEEQQKEIYTQINKNLPVLIKKELDAKLNKSVRHVEAFISIQQYLTHGDCITGFHGWPISPDMGVFLLEKIRERNYDAIIEFGSGVSTLLIAKGLMAFNLFKDNEDKCFISFDHDEYYFTNTQSLLAYHGVESMVDLYLTPLKEWSDGTGCYKYYSCEDVLIELAKRIQDGSKRLLVLVDGPPGNTCANARYPALPFMSHFISNHEIDWVLDDAYRDEEKLTAELWKKYWSAENIQFTHDFIKNEKGMFFATTYGRKSTS